MFPEPPLYVHRRNFIHEYAGFRPRVGRSTVEKEVILPPGKALVDSTVFECFVDGGDCNSFHAPIVSNRLSLSTLFESISNKVLDFRTILEHPHLTAPRPEGRGLTHFLVMTKKLVGMVGLEPTTLCSSAPKADALTRLRHTPMFVLRATEAAPRSGTVAVHCSLSTAIAPAKASSAVTAYSPPKTSGAAYCFSNTSRYISSNSSNSSFCSFKFFRW